MVAGGAETDYWRLLQQVRWCKLACRCSLGHKQMLAQEVTWPWPEVMVASLL